MRITFIVVFILAFNYLYSQVLLPDTLLKQNCGIILTDKVILDVQVWSVSDVKIEYYDGKSLHDLNRSDIKRFDFKDYSAIIKDNKLNKIKVYDLLVVSNTYQGIKEVNENNKIFFSKKNNSTVKSYPSYTEFVNGYDIYNSEKQIQAETKVFKEEVSANNSAKKDSISGTNTIVQADSIKKDTTKIQNTIVVDQKLNPDMLDPVASYNLGKEKAIKLFNAREYTALSCVSFGCTGGVLSPLLLLVKPDKIKPQNIPNNVNQQMFEEGYYNKVHEMRRRSYVKGTFIFVGTVAASYVAAIAIALIAGI